MKCNNPQIVTKSRNGNPTGLINDMSRKEMVCFLNATLQALNNIPEFVDYVRNLQLYDHPSVQNLKSLFSLMSMPNQCIKTANFARRITVAGSWIAGAKVIKLVLPHFCAVMLKFQIKLRQCCHEVVDNPGG